MLKKVVGLKRVEYVSKKGYDVKGWEIHLAHEAEGVQGVLTESKYFSDKDFVRMGVTPEDIFERSVDIYYDEYKKPRYIRVEG